jgi:hypothetical protein
MNITNKNEAFEFLREKHFKKETLTDEVKQEVLKFFTQEELDDISFDKINISNCFSHHSN